MPVNLSPLDSERFGVVVARADDIIAGDVPGLLSFCDQHSVDLVIARCNGQDLPATRTLLAARMSEVEAQITYEGPLEPAPPNASIRQGVAADEADIAELAAVGFRDMPSHYHADPRLPLEACRDIYLDWSLRGLRGEAADLFCVAEVDGSVAGFSMFGCNGNKITTLLSTISPSARGLGLYNALIRVGMKWGAERGAQSMIGVTPHGNIAAQRNLIKLGLAPVGSTATFHGWKDEKSWAARLDPIGPR